MSKNSGGDSGLGLGTVLTLIFLVLKLMGLTKMSWFWVFFPMGLGILFWVVLIILVVIASKN
jgi:hypothetical protein